MPDGSELNRQQSHGERPHPGPGSTYPQTAQRPQPRPRSNGARGAHGAQGAHGAHGAQGAPDSQAPSANPMGAKPAGPKPAGAHSPKPAAGRPASAKSKSRSRYVPALDGLRCLAVVAVIAYHMHFDWAPGGLLGVTMFFVLSGYLITGLLLKEYKETRTISLSNFWLRRVRRIIPAIVFAVLGTAILCAIFDQALLTKMRPDVLPTLFFFNNWWQIFHNVSYFDALGEPSPLLPCWSLSIEEQFYLIWPVALLILLKIGVSRKVIRNGTLVLAALSALEMALLFNPHVDPSRIYYGTDTRAFSLLIGSFLAFVWPYQRLTERAGEAMSTGGRLAFNLVGVAAVVGLFVMVATTNGFQPFIYQGGLVICSVLTALAIAVMVHPISWIGKIFAFKPFVFIGKISYSMYLWHYPVILLMTPNNIQGTLPLWLCGLQFLVIVGLSTLSYYVVENPIRHGAIGKVMANVKAGVYTYGEYLRKHVVGVIVVIAFFAGSIGSLLFVPPASAVNGPGLKSDLADRTAQAVEKEKLFVEAEREARKLDILLLGDSVPEATYGYGAFSEVFPTGFIDAIRGRQFYMAPELYKSYKDAGMVGDVVVFALGTNGYATDEEFDALMAEVGPDQQVWFVNTRSPEDYMEESNATIQRGVDRYENAHLIDWYTLSADHEDYFDGDGTHLTPEAAKVYSQMIYDAVKDYLPAEAKAGAGDASKGGASDATHNEMDPYL